MAVGLQEALDRFRESYFYEDAAILVDELLEADEEARRLVARLDTRRPLPFGDLQRVRDGHPRHLAGGDILMATAALGSLHAWLFHGVRWEDGWVGFGSRIHRGDFRRLARVGPSLELRCREARSRRGAGRLVIRYEFDFSQRGETVYVGDQTAIFLREGVTA